MCTNIKNNAFCFWKFIKPKRHGSQNVMWRNTVVRFCHNTSIFNHNNCRSFISSDKSKVFEIDIENFKAIKLSLKRIRSESDTILAVIYRIIYLSFHACWVCRWDWFSTTVRFLFTHVFVKCWFHHCYNDRNCTIICVGIECLLTVKQDVYLLFSLPGDTELTSECLMKQSV